MPGRVETGFAQKGEVAISITDGFRPTLPTLATHYTTLGVSDDATTAEIRRAYLALARTLHPDRQLDASPTESAAAARKMQDVNVAWRVLSDPARRYAYDLSLPTASSTARPRGQASPTSAATEDESADVVSSIIHGVPWLLLVGLLGGIFIFTAYAAGSNRTDPSAPPVVGAEANSCFVFVKDATLPVSCEGPNDGIVTAKVALGSGGCAPTVTSIYLSGEQQLLCYRVP